MGHFANLTIETGLDWSDEKLWHDEKTVEEIKFEYSVSRKLMNTIYGYDVSMHNMWHFPNKIYTKRLHGLLPRKEKIDLCHKKAMYYSISGHAYKLLGCVDEAREAFKRAKK